MPTIAELLRGLLMYAILPLWVLAGFLDWQQHRSSRIESTTGITESVFHWVLFAEGGCALFCALVLPFQPMLVALAFTLLAAHELTTWLELKVVVGGRFISPAEQMLHSFLEILPWCAIVTVYLLRTTEIGLPAVAAYSEILTPTYLALLFLFIVVMNVLPLTEETLRCLRARDG